MMTISKKLNFVISKYEKDHQHPMCIRLHNIGIPMLTLGTMSLLAYLPSIGGVDFRFLLLLSNLIYFCALDVRTGILFTLFVGISSYILSHFLSLQYSWILFSLGWSLAISGHFIFEKNKPAFFENVSQTFLGVGPMSMFVRIIKFKRPFSNSTPV